LTHGTVDSATKQTRGVSHCHLAIYIENYLKANKQKKHVARKKKKHQTRKKEERKKKRMQHVSFAFNLFLQM
jgi:hypothetical protein